MYVDSFDIQVHCIYDQSDDSEYRLPSFSYMLWMFDSFVFKLEIQYRIDHDFLVVIQAHCDSVQY